jgi:hypothetical protein
MTSVIEKLSDFTGDPTAERVNSVPHHEYLDKGGMNIADYIANGGLNEIQHALGEGAVRPDPVTNGGRTTHDISSASGLINVRIAQSTTPDGEPRVDGSIQMRGRDPFTIANARVLRGEGGEGVMFVAPLGPFGGRDRDSEAIRTATITNGRVRMDYIDPAGLEASDLVLNTAWVATAMRDRVRAIAPARRAA